VRNNLGRKKSGRQSKKVETSQQDTLPFMRIDTHRQKVAQMLPTHHCDTAEFKTELRNPLEHEGAP
jgi:hypothetical protein